MRLVLASGSPRRRQVLEAVGLRFEVLPAYVDETRHPEEPPDGYVERVARAKAEAVAGPGLVVVGADTAVVHQGRVMGKPVHPEEARTMLRRLQGDRHEVLTGLAVTGWDDGPVTRSLVDGTEVDLLPMTEEEIASYVGGGEPLDKAGGYALQGWGGLYVAAVRGSPFTVVGLPIHLLPRLLAAVGTPLDGFRHRAG